MTCVGKPLSASEPRVSSRDKGYSSIWVKSLFCHEEFQPLEWGKFRKQNASDSIIILFLSNCFDVQGLVNANHFHRGWIIQAEQAHQKIQKGFELVPTNSNLEAGQYF